MKSKYLLVLVLVAAASFACDGSGDDGNNGNNGWIDATVDGNDDDSGDDTGPDWRTCSEPSDCVLVANSCCGVCGPPELEDRDAVNKSRTDEHFQEVCPEPQPCPECVEEFNPYLVATCEQQSCIGYDVRRESFTECETDADCRVRVRECCECGGTTDPYSLIAIAQDGEAAYTDLVCGGPVDCPACEPVYPDNATAVCGDAGHCEVEVEL
jgi:hypothetical protein